ncbi:MAG: PSD1 and planctomycete cytochrome C domain-containing protein [Planctomycetota bacterium]|nr:PSD1 and planctomycete cytochrome C domain-containing protein [Planctomycetota bacterium]
MTLAFDGEFVAASTSPMHFVTREGEAPAEPWRCKLGRSLALPLELLAGSFQPASRFTRLSPYGLRRSANEVSTSWFSASIFIFASTIPMAMLRGQDSPADEMLASQFHNDVRPILQKRCYSCHSHSAGVIESELTLDWKIGWEKGGSRGPAIQAGNPDQSLLLKAIRHELPDLKMPEEKLPDAEILAIENWVKNGAFDDRVSLPQNDAVNARDWWSLRPLTRPNPPNNDINNPIDAFIVARLRDQRLTQSRRADRPELIRRVYYDLTGLPPTPKETRDFELDPDEHAYQHLVDRLLNSERYGERWARHWFDAIHFADSHGYEHDVGRDNAWPYRDYMIDALNQDKPWSRMIREQLATDYFYPDEPQWTPALGFLGAGTFDLSTFATAPVTFDYLDRDDMVTQTLSAFSSTTANCARCHAHKFDPISQEDYYSLQAVFSGILKGDITYDPTLEILKQRREIQELLDTAEQRNRSILTAFEYKPEILENLTVLSQQAKWQSLELLSYVATDSSTLTREPDGSLLASGINPERDTYVITASSSYQRLSAIRLDVIANASLPMNGPGRCQNGNLHLSEIEVHVFDPANAKSIPIKIKRATADFNQQAWGIERAIDGDPTTAWGIHPAVGQSHYAVFEFEEAIALSPETRLTVVLKQLHGGSHLIGALKLSATADDPSGIQAKPLEVENILQKHASVLSNSSHSITAETWNSINEADRITLASFVVKDWAIKQKAKLPEPRRVFAAGKTVAIPEGNGKDQLKSLASPKTVHVLHRGDFDKPRETVGPGSISVLKEIESRFELKDSDREPVRRAKLADWIAHKENVLTWRSIVNRVWHHHFGRGICDTPSDFGRMGGVPSHPELLDWLAVWFRDDAKESLKALHRLIVTSDTYCQVSTSSEDGNKTDSENRLLWRQNRQRLDADAVRDFVLAASGQLNLKMGGPADQQFRQSKGPQSTPELNYSVFDWDSPAGKRRSIYRYVWRGIADPFMEAVDFPDLGLLSPARGVSSSSLQSLSLFNNDFILAESQAMATQLEALSPGLDGQVTECVWRLWNRAPNSNEIEELSRFAKLHSVAELCRVLMNSNEFLFVD